MEPPSLGNSAIFLIGGLTRSVEPVPILLRSGDIIIMSGPGCRRAYHGELFISRPTCLRTLTPVNIEVFLGSWRTRFQRTSDLHLQGRMVGSRSPSTFRQHESTSMCGRYFPQTLIPWHGEELSRMLVRLAMRQDCLLRGNSKWREIPVTGISKFINTLDLGIVLRAEASVLKGYRQIASSTMLHPNINQMNHLPTGKYIINRYLKEGWTGSRLSTLSYKVPACIYTCT
jgi:hypothetical protein